MKNNYKFWIIFSFFIVFAAGIFTGVLLQKYMLSREPASTPRDSSWDQRRGSVHFPTLDIMAEELELTSEQKRRIKEIFENNEIRLKKLRNHIHEEFSSMRGELLQQIKSVLYEEQITKFDAMIERYLSQRRKQAEKRHSHPRQNNKGEER